MTNHTLHVEQLGEIALRLDERGRGAMYLLLHGGGGPATMARFAELLSAHGRVITPTYPGFAGTARPFTVSTVADLAKILAALLVAIDAHNVTVVANSLGGWVGSELALLVPTRLSRLILINSVGIEVEGHPLANLLQLTPAQLLNLTYHDPSKLPRAHPTEEENAVMAADAATSALYAGPASADPTLRARLAKVTVPTAVFWGESDRIVDAAYGRAYAAAFPDGRFELLPQAGHLPQIETPEALLQAILRT